MGAITDSELVAARADLATMLPDTCAIQRKTVGSDGGGGQTEIWPDLATGMPCRVTPAVAIRLGSTVAGDRLDSTTTHVITLAAGTDIRAGDRIVVSGVAYGVLVVGDGGQWEMARHVEVRRAA